MTFRERFLQDHPSIEENAMLQLCPSDIGYEKFKPCAGILWCDECWNREMEGDDNGNQN